MIIGHRRCHCGYFVRFDVVDWPYFMTREAFLFFGFCVENLIDEMR